MSPDWVWLGNLCREGGFAAELTPMLNGRVYPLRVGLWKGEVKIITHREFLFSCTARTAEEAAEQCEHAARAKLLVYQ